MLRLPVFYRQYTDGFYPCWAYLLPSIIFRLPYSLLKALVFCGIVMGLTGIVEQFGRWDVLTGSVREHNFDTPPPSPAPSPPPPPPPLSPLHA